jgi:hypothetical protein
MGLQARKRCAAGKWTCLLTTMSSPFRRAQYERGATMAPMRRGAMIRAHRDKTVTLLGEDEFINNAWQTDRQRG